jgi:hypothetical protein
MNILKTIHGDENPLNPLNPFSSATGGAKANKCSVEVKKDAQQPKAANDAQGKNFTCARDANKRKADEKNPFVGAIMSSTMDNTPDLAQKKFLKLWSKADEINGEIGKIKEKMLKEIKKLLANLTKNLVKYPEKRNTIWNIDEKLYKRIAKDMEKIRELEEKLEIVKKAMIEFINNFGGYDAGKSDSLKKQLEKSGEDRDLKSDAIKTFPPFILIYEGIKEDPRENDNSKYIAELKGKEGELVDSFKNKIKTSLASDREDINGYWEAFDKKHKELSKKEA